MSVASGLGSAVAVQLYTPPQQQSVTSPDAAAPAAGTAAAGTAAAPAGSDQVQVSSAVTLKNLDTVRAIEQHHSAMNKLITGARQTNEALNGAVDQISRMTTSLEGITKNFPPFPADSKERQQLLMSYTSIRQELLKMTVPAPPPTLYEKVKSLWQSLVGPNGQLSAAAVPALGQESTDQQVHDTLSQTQQTGSRLASLSSAVTQALVGP